MSNCRSIEYISPQHSPDIRHNSDPCYPESHRTECDRPSEPPLHPDYHSYSVQYPAFHPNNAPLSPPASDGIMSPPLPGLEFAKTQMTPHMHWNHQNSFPIKDDPTYASSRQTPPTMFIEDIFQQDPNVMEQSYIDAQGVKRRVRDIRDVYLGMAPGSGSEYSSGASMGLSPSPSLYHGSQGMQETPRRKKRHLTEPAEANYECNECGKLFSRVWNYNAHLDTHRPDRPRPHVCPEQDCGKAFVRRTDLTRHTQCVHQREKRYRCELCNNMFARKDTLRRHEDDGCSKRVDIVSRHAKNRPMTIQSTALNACLAEMGQKQQPQQQLFYSQYDQLPQGYDNGLPPLSDMVRIEKTGW